MRGIYWLFAALLVVFVGSPAFAWDKAPAFAWQSVPAGDICYGCGYDTIYGLTNLVNYLEANPDVDETFKGPIITEARAKILWLRAAMGPQPLVSPTPCCYARKPLYIR